MRAVRPARTVERLRQRGETRDEKTVWRREWRDWGKVGKVIWGKADWGEGRDCERERTD